MITDYLFLLWKIEKTDNKNTALGRYLCYAWLQLRNTLAERGLRPQAHSKSSRVPSKNQEGCG